ncbi:uncharacterized protein LOC135174591 [Pogoniulus pusillus]|uniref:uncharacterized protein LOC135174591 n=1 Tax=Pogoniulus pusillus TaxID=488313 RepID=UPI0030B92157
MAAKSPLQSLQEEATCSVCLDFFIEPIMLLPCSHNFCRRCLDYCPADATTGTRSCPQCRSPFPPDSFRPNCHLANVVEAIKKLIALEERSRTPRGRLSGRDGTVPSASRAEGRSRSLVPLEEAVSECEPPRHYHAQHRQKGNQIQSEQGSPGRMPDSSDAEEEFYGGGKSLQARPLFKTETIKGKKGKGATTSQSPLAAWRKRCELRETFSRAPHESVTDYVCRVVDNRAQFGRSSPAAGDARLPDIADALYARFAFESANLRKAMTATANEPLEQVNVRSANIIVSLYEAFKDVEGVNKESFFDLGVGVFRSQVEVEAWKSEVKKLNAENARQEVQLLKAQQEIKSLQREREAMLKDTIRQSLSFRAEAAVAEDRMRVVEEKLDKVLSRMSRSRSSSRGSTPQMQSAVSSRADTPQPRSRIGSRTETPQPSTRTRESTGYLSLPAFTPIHPEKSQQPVVRQKEPGAHWGSASSFATESPTSGRAAPVAAQAMRLDTVPSGGAQTAYLANAGPASRRFAFVATGAASTAGAGSAVTSNNGADSPDTAAIFPAISTTTAIFSTATPRAASAEQHACAAPRRVADCSYVC